MTPAPLFAALCISLGVLFAFTGGSMDLAGAVFFVVGGLWLGVCLPEPPENREETK